MKFVNTINEVWRRARPASPSFFDICLAFFLIGIAYFTDDYQRRLLFNLGSIGLLCITLPMRQRRDFRSLPLALFVLWSFAGIFIHSWDNQLLQGDVAASYYLSVMILSEGFIYVLSGALLIFLIVRYAKSRIFLYSALLIASYPLMLTIFKYTRFTLPLSFAMGAVIYGFMKRKYLISSLVVLSGVIVVALKWSMFCIKLYYRPYVWMELVRFVARHPWVGAGNVKGLHRPNLFWVDSPPQWMINLGFSSVKQGWLLKHNDYLNVAVYMGILAMIFMIIFTFVSIRKIKHHPLCVIFLGVVIGSFFQCNMFWVYKASLLITAGALALSVGYEPRSLSE